MIYAYFFKNIVVYNCVQIIKKSQIFILLV